MTDDVSTRDLPIVRPRRTPGDDAAPAPAADPAPAVDPPRAADPMTDADPETDGVPGPSVEPADDDLTALWPAVEEGLARAGRHGGAVVTLRGLDGGGRRALGDLLGRRAAPGPVRVEVDALETAVRARVGVSLADAVRAAKEGTSRRDRRRSAPSGWDAARGWLEEHPAVGGQPWTRGWLADVRRDAAGAATAQHTVTALEVLAAVLVDGAGGWRSRAELAAYAAGEESALDDGSPVADLVLRGLAAARGWTAPRDAAARRALWTGNGVLPDLLSVSCLVLGVAPTGEEGGRRWRLAALEGAPVQVTARDLRTHAEPWVAVDEAWPYVLVCQHPAVVQVFAERFGGRVPVVCTSGMPEPLAVELLHRLRTAGADLRLHGDLDWPGVAAANLLSARCRAQPWRMGADDYRAAVSAELPALDGGRVTPAWDADLGAAMAAAGRAVPQEHVLSDLVSAVRAELA